MTTGLPAVLDSAVPARVSFPALGTTAELIVLDARALPAGTELLERLLADIDHACSRFRWDSEISAAHRAAGRPVQMSAMLAAAIDVSLRAAAQTDGLVDPTVGQAIRDLGYDRDFADVVNRAGPPAPPEPAPGWWRIGFDAKARTVLIPKGVVLDLGSTAKALAADWAAAQISDATGSGVLVNLGGDIAVAGPEPTGGWRVRIRDAHDAPVSASDPTVSITDGGIATSSIVRRAWRQHGRAVHHIVDPRTGDLAMPRWRTVTVAAATCVEANTASTAAIVFGDAATDWLRVQEIPARLVAIDGEVTTVCGWPDDVSGATT